jgi:hypothetical protein
MEILFVSYDEINKGQESQPPPPFYDNNYGSVIWLTITNTGLGRTIAANLTFYSGFGWANTPTVWRFLRYATLGASQQEEEQKKQTNKNNK